VTSVLLITEPFEHTPQFSNKLTARQCPAKQLGAAPAPARATQAARRVHRGRGNSSSVSPAEAELFSRNNRGRNPQVGFIYLCQEDKRHLRAIAQWLYLLICSSEGLYLTLENSNICTSPCQLSGSRIPVLRLEPFDCSKAQGNSHP